MQVSNQRAFNFWENYRFRNPYGPWPDFSYQEFSFRQLEIQETKMGNGRKKAVSSVIIELKHSAKHQNLDHARHKEIAVSHCWAHPTSILNQNYIVSYIAH